METLAEVEAIEVRLQSLERQNRITKGAMTLLGIALAAVVLMGQAKSPKSVEAGSLILRDMRGEVRAMIGPAPDGAFGVFLFEGGKVRVGLSIAQSGMAGLGISDRGDTPWRPDCQA